MSLGNYAVLDTTRQHNSLNYGINNESLILCVNRFIFIYVYECSDWREKMMEQLYH